jgi:CMP-N,N'-diacetyllegionaminic acid synthase
VNVLFRLDADLVTSVCPVKHHPYWMYRVKDGYAEPLFSNAFAVRRQDLPQVYSLNGAVYVYKREQILKPKPMHEIRQGVWIMDMERSVDIDTKFDFQLAETWLRTYRR